SAPPASNTAAPSASIALRCITSFLLKLGDLVEQGGARDLTQMSRDDLTLVIDKQGRRERSAFEKLHERSVFVDRNGSTAYARSFEIPFDLLGGFGLIDQ